MDTAAAAASATTARPSFNPGFFASPAGWFKLAEIIMGILVFGIVAGARCPYEPPWVFVLFVSITAWIFALALAVIYMFAVHSTVLSGAPWDILEFGINASWSTFYFIAAIVAAANVDVWGPKCHSHYVASTVFAFFITIVYIAHTLFAYRTWRGEFPCSSSPAGNNVNT